MQDQLRRGEGSISKVGNRHKALARIDGRNRYVGMFDTYELALAAIRTRRSGHEVPSPVNAPERTDEPTILQRSDSGVSLRAWGRTWLKRREQEGRRSHKDTVDIWKKAILLTPFIDKAIDRITPKDIS